MRNAIVMLAVAAVLALAVPAGAVNYTWTADTGAFHDALNWDVGIGHPSTADDRAYIQNGGTAQVSQTDLCKTCKVGFYSSDLLTGGIGHLGLIADVTFSPRWLMVGHYVPWTDPVSTLTQTAGTLDVTDYFRLGQSLSSGDSAETGKGQYTISGGSLAVTNWMDVGRDSTDDGKGLFKIDNGTGAVSGVNSLNIGSYFVLTTHSTLEVVLSGSGGTTPVQVGTDATLRGTLTIDDSNYTPIIGDKVTVLTCGGTLDTTGLVSGNPDWQINTYTGGSGSVEVEYIPEPATMVLLGIGGIGVLLRRRRK